MKCPSCNKVLSNDISVCPGCGTMRNDSVREELALKISPRTGADSGPFELDLGDDIITPPVRRSVLPPNSGNLAHSQPISTPRPPEKIETAQIAAKPTSPTLVEFRRTNAVVPEWRLQMQNAVRKRIDRGGETTSVTDVIGSHRVAPTVGATALKAETRPEAKIEETAKPAANPTLANALLRIEQSRQQFFAEEKPKTSAFGGATAAPAKSYPFTVVNSPAPSVEQTPAGEERSRVDFESLTFPIRTKLDTNKLPPLSEVLEQGEAAESRAENLKVFKKSGEETIHATQDANVDAAAEEEEEFDDCAPLALRFNAGLFDLIIGSFAGFVLLAPFMLLNGNLFSIEGFLAFLATTAIVMFIYLTSSVALFGRTLGMRLFSLEMIDVEANDYPTFHQAAVNSVVYIFSLALGGIGFLTLLFNEERRAAHDLAAGTIIIKEF